MAWPAFLRRHLMVGLLGVVPLTGQFDGRFSPPGQECWQAWDGGQLATWWWTSVREEGLGFIRNPQGRRLTVVPAPPPKTPEEKAYSSSHNFFRGNMSHADGTFFISLGDQPPVQKGEEWINRRDVLRWDASTRTWGIHGRLEGMGPLAAAVINEDLLLGISFVGNGIPVGSKGYPFGVFRRDAKGRYHLKDAQDAHLEKPYFHPSRKWSHYPGLDTDFLRMHLVFGPHYVVMKGQYGHFWVIDRDTGRVKRLVKLYRSLEDKVLESREHGLLPVVYDMHPTPDGNFRFAARTEGYMRARIDGGFPPDAAPDRVLDIVNKREPHLDWFELDPETGKIHRIATPVGMPERFADWKEAKAFSWRFKPGGGQELTPKLKVLRPSQGDDPDKLVQR